MVSVSLGAVAREPIEIIKDLSAQTLAGFPGDVFALLAEDFVFLSWDGHVFVGHEGLVAWFEGQLRGWEEISFRRDSSEEVGGGWVLTKGDIVFKRRNGDEHLQPGYWLAQVQNGKIVAVLYYRTQDEARSALKLDRPGP